MPFLIFNYQGEVMREQNKILRNWNIDNSWSVFLDRDGVINKRLIDDYVKSWNEFEFLPNVFKALKIFNDIFNKIFVVTNQRGIVKKLMTQKDLNDIHKKMLEHISKNNGRIDKIYCCIHDSNDKCACRKPAIGMGLNAKKDFPVVDFKKSIIVGDSKSDIDFGKALDMKTVFIGKDITIKSDLRFETLSDFAIVLEDVINT
jgi:D-glycero-D-manno-heptose 1,7-bisphosphate phosphatase